MRYSIPISIIMPCYKGGSSLAKSIESVLNQTFSDFELLIINDHSTITTDNIIRSFNDKRISVVQNQIYKGYFSSINTGMLCSKGKYLCMMDPTNFAVADRLQFQFKYLEKHLHVGCIGGQYEIIDDEGQTIEITNGPSTYSGIKLNLIKGSYINQPTMMIRTFLVKKHNLLYNCIYKDASAYDFIVRASKEFRIKNINQTFVKSEISSNQSLSVTSLEQKYYFDIIRRKQLNHFGIKYTRKELLLHLKLVNDSYIGDSELELSESWLNKLLEANSKRKVYSNTQLFNFFKQLMLKAIQNNSLGGWAIEKDLINYIRDSLSTGDSILEFGSGRGTEALLEYYDVTSVEHNSKFCFSRSSNHKCILAPIENGWYDRTIVENILKAKYDLILIDGPPGELRNGLLENLGLFNGSSALIIFDDVNRTIDREIMLAFCKDLNYDHKIIMGNEKAFCVCRKKI